MTQAGTDLVPSPKQERSMGGLGASEASAAIGMSPYQRPIDLWLQHTGRKPPFAGNEATFFGHVLEPVIRAHYVELNKVAVHVPPESIWHADLPWLKATPDGIVIDDAGAWKYVAPQVKNVGLRQAPAWEDGPPDHYVIQAVVEMSVTDLDRLDFAVLIGGQHYEQFTVHRDDNLEASVLDELAAFWDHVQTDKPPALDDSSTFRSFLLGQITRKKIVEATGIDANYITEWRDVVRQMRELKTAEARVKNLIAESLAIQDANKMTSAIGDISLTAPPRKTAWKAVAEELSIHVIDFKDIVARHTATGEPNLRRPQNWAASDDDNQEGT